MKIFKYKLCDFPLPVGETLKIKAPQKFLQRKMARQGNSLCLWAEVDPNFGEEVEHWFTLVPTGAEIKTGTYIDTFFNGPFVWHLYKL